MTLSKIWEASAQGTKPVVYCGDFNTGVYVCGQDSLCIVVILTRVYVYVCLPQRTIDARRALYIRKD